MRRRNDRRCCRSYRPCFRNGRTANKMILAAIMRKIPGKPKAHKQCGRHRRHAPEWCYSSFGFCSTFRLRRRKRCRRRHGIEMYLRGDAIKMLFQKTAVERGYGLQCLVGMRCKSVHGHAAERTCVEVRFGRVYLFGLQGAGKIILHLAAGEAGALVEYMNQRFVFRFHGCTGLVVSNLFFRLRLPFWILLFTCISV